MSRVLTLNYGSLLNKLISLNKSLDKPYTSLAGRVAASKILLLPHILYIFRTIPARLSIVYISKVQGVINNYVWRRKLMTRSRSRAGLAVPNVVAYYKATVMDQLQFW